MSDKYFPLDSLESDPNKLIAWLTDYDTQRLVSHHFETHQVFIKNHDNRIFVYKGLEFYYNLWFNQDKTLKQIGIDLPPETE